MPTKKIVKKQPAKKMAAKPMHTEHMDLKKTLSTHGSFLALIAVFAGFSLYAVVSFAGSTSNYIQGMYASVIDANQEVVVADSSYEVFSDLKSNAPHAVAIERLKKLGIFGGYTDGSFKPDKLLTRAELLTVTASAMDIDFSGASYGNCFKDVKNEYFAVPVCYAFKQGWVKGLKDGRFGPNDSVRYPEVLKVVVSVFGFVGPDKVEVEPLTGVKVTAWYAPTFKAAIDYGLIDGNFVFNPNYALTRADFAEVIYRAVKAKGLLE
jgi:hypothetical protein